MKETCSVCRFASKIEAGEGSIGGYVCRRNPPAVVPMMEQAPRSIQNPTGQGMVMMLRGYHPPVKPEQWCGEYAAPALLGMSRKPS